MLIAPLTGERTFAVSQRGHTKILKEWGMGNAVLKPMTDKLAGSTVIFASEVAPYGSFRELFREVRAFIHKYLELPDTTEALTALFVIFTWLSDACPTVPYGRALGDWGTGKTRALEVLGAVCYRAIIASGALTPSPLFRILDAYAGTLILDEADFTRSDSKAEIIKILNTGYKLNGRVTRSELWVRGGGRPAPGASLARRFWRQGSGFRTEPWRVGASPGRPRG